MDLQDSLVTFLRHFPRTDDATLIILKGHLLLEEEINNLLHEMLPNPEALDGLQINFFTKTQFARALIKNEALDTILDAAEKLNRLRNRLAHNLEPSGVEAAIRDFVTAADGRILGGETAPEQQLKRRIAFLCGQLLRFRTEYRAARQILKNRVGAGKSKPRRS
jgi:hypothetical protein